MLDLPQKAPQQVIVQQVTELKVDHDLEIKLDDKKKETVHKDELAQKESKTKKLDAYDKLPCSEQDKACVHQIITTVADNGKLSLLFKQNELKALGSQINHLHPLKFLSAIFTNPDLKQRMEQIFGDYFKRNAFMDEIGSGLTSESEKGGLTHSIIEKFAKEVNIPAAQLRPFFEAQDWDGLVEVLING